MNLIQVIIINKTSNHFWKMKLNLMEDIYQAKNYSKKLSIFDDENDLFQNLTLNQRSNSDPSSIINQSENIPNKLQMGNTSKNDSEENPINQLKDENFKSVKDNIQNNSQLSINLINMNNYGFKGRSPYTNMNTNLNNINDKKEKKEHLNYISSNKNVLNSNQDPKRINGFILSELKDKILDYKCSICNFKCNDRDELRNHLAIKKHFTFPRKLKKGKKHIMKNKTYYKNEIKNSQSFMYSLMKQNKKPFDKKITCRHCSKKFDSMYALNSHLNAHKYKCEICFKLFNNKEDLIKHKHCEKNTEDDFESLYEVKKMNKYSKKEYKSPPRKPKMEIDDWEEISSNKNEKWESDDEFYKNDDFEKSYVFIEDSDENFDFNKMVKVNDK